jgi:hypothetical protein
MSGLGDFSFYWCIGESAAGEAISAVCLLLLEMKNVGQEWDRAPQMKKAHRAENL